MTTRRALFGRLLAAPLLALLGGARAAHARRPAPALVLGTPYRGVAVDAVRGTLPVLGHGDRVRLGRALTVREVAVFALGNANDRYVALVHVAETVKDMVYLLVRDPAGAAAGAAAATSPGPVLVRSESWGGGFSGRKGSGLAFHVDRALADELAARWGVPRRDRTPLGAGLVARWRPRAQPFRVGAPMEIVLELENRGTSPVWFMIGGRQRGPRNNRFAFEATRAGASAPLPVIEAFDFGGPGGHEELPPGGTREVAADLASWVVLDEAGAYRVACRFELELVTGPHGASWPDHGHETWDWRGTGTIDVVVTR